MECCFVVAIKSHKDILDDAKVPEKPLKQNEFTCVRGHGTIFSLSRGARGTSLLLGLPREV